MKNINKLFAVTSILLLSGGLSAQGTIDDYQRVLSLPEKYKNAVPNANITPRWMNDTHQFWYVRDTPDGEEYVVIDAEKNNA